jgi:hypothetical protein
MASLQIVFHYRLTGSYAVFPIDLFAFCISPTAVGNAHLDDLFRSCSFHCNRGGRLKCSLFQQAVRNSAVAMGFALVSEFRWRKRAVVLG